MMKKLLLAALAVFFIPHAYAGIEDYSTTPASNTALFPENMNPSDVNDNLRQVQADIRSWYNTPQWTDLGDTPTYASSTSFTLSGDLTATYLVGRRIRMYGTTMGTLYGTIATSSYSNPNTTVTVTMDSGSLTANLSVVSLGIDPTNDPIPVAAISGAATLAGDQTFSGDNTFSGEITFSSATLVKDSLFTINDNSDATKKIAFEASGITTGTTRTITVPDGSGEIFYISNVLDEDDMSSDSDTFPATQQSIKAYVDNEVSGASITLGAAQATTTGTSIDFTSIPAGTKAITINFSGVSTNGTDNWLVQLGDSGGVETTGYLGSGSRMDNSGTTSDDYTAGFGVRSVSASEVLHGTITLTLMNTSPHTWAAHGVIGSSTGAGGAGGTYQIAGVKALSAELDRVRITTSGGTNTFDAGSINITTE